MVQTLGDWNHTEVNALAGTVTVQIEIFSARDQALDDVVFPMYQELGDDMPEWFDVMGLIPDNWPRRLI